MRILLLGAAGSIGRGDLPASDRAARMIASA
jgi:hypothetical protein